jgi:hypothetical protein
VTASYFPSADEMRAMLSPVARDAEKRLGSKASLFTITRVRRADGSYGPPTTPTESAVDIPIKLTSVTLERAQAVFGLDTDVLMTGKTSRANALLPGMVFTITDGDFSGQSFEVTKRVERPLSDSYVLGLKEHALVAA